MVHESLDWTCQGQIDCGRLSGMDTPLCDGNPFLDTAWDQHLHRRPPLTCAQDSCTDCLSMLEGARAKVFSQTHAVFKSELHLRCMPHVPRPLITSASKGIHISPWHIACSGLILHSGTPSNFDDVARHWTKCAVEDPLKS